MEVTHSEGKMWKHSTVVLAIVLLLASGLFLLLQATPAPQQSGRLVVPLDQDRERLVTDLEEGDRKPDRVRADQADLNAVKAGLEADLAAARSESADYKGGLERSVADLAERDARIGALLLERTNLMTRVTDLIAARQAVEKRLEEVQQEKNQLAAILEQLRGERDTMEAALSQAETRRDGLAEKVEDLRGKVAKFSLESGELEELGKSETKVPDSEDPQAEKLQERAEGTSSDVPQTPEQAGDGGDSSAKRWAIPLEKETLFAGTQDRSDLEAAVTVVDDGPSARVSGVLEQGVEQYNQGQYAVAFDIWYPLAEQGVRRAQFYVGSLFHEGRGVEQDQIKAFYWLSLSDKAGYPSAGRVLQTVEEVMTEAQMAAAFKLLDTANN